MFSERDFVNIWWPNYVQEIALRIYRFYITKDSLFLQNMIYNKNELYIKILLLCIWSIVHEFVKTSIYRKSYEIPQNL